jgi:hypothetical protein
MLDLAQASREKEINLTFFLSLPAARPHFNTTQDTVLYLQPAIDLLKFKGIPQQLGTSSGMLILFRITITK